MLPTDNNNNNEKWLIRDCTGYIFATLTHLLLLYAIVTLCYFHFLPLNGEISRTFLFLFFIVLYIGCVTSHRKAMITNPGALNLNTFNLDDHEPNNIPKFCAKCNCIKIAQSHHCSICQRCIRKMDHHCPWINNCVGENNIRYFLIFCFYIFLFSTMTLIMFIVKLITNGSIEKQLDNGNPMAIVCSAILSVESFVFCFFTIIMIISQIVNVFQDTTSIGKLKNEYFTSGKTKLQKMTEIFGEPISYRWLLPVDPVRAYPPPLNDLTV